MKLGILVNSHTDYQAALVLLLHTLRGWPDIAVVQGGYKETGGLVLRDVPVTKATHDSYDCTSLIELIRDSSGILPGCTHVLCLQDTMQAGSRTLPILRSWRPKEFKAHAAWGGLCNLVIYERDYLESKAEFINQQRNHSKLDSIKLEGSLYHQVPDHLRTGLLHCGRPETRGIHHPYNDTPRLLEYYRCLDLIKWKANYGQNMQALITTL